MGGREEIIGRCRFILLPFVAILLAASTTAIGDERYLALTSNTDYCTACETTYFLNATLDAVRVDCDGLRFKETKTSALKNGTAITYLSQIGLLRNVSSTFVPRTCYGVVNSSNSTNGTALGTYECGRYEDVYTPLSCPHTFAQGQTAKIKVVGVLEPDKFVDNVLTLDVKGREELYEQWAVWNSSQTFSRWKFEQNGNDDGNFSNTLSTVA